MTAGHRQPDECESMQLKSKTCHATPSTEGSSVPLSERERWFEDRILILLTIAKETVLKLILHSFHF